MLTLREADLLGSLRGVQLLLGLSKIVPAQTPLDGALYGVMKSMEKPLAAAAEHCLDGSCVGVRARQRIRQDLGEDYLADNPSYYTQGTINALLSLYSKKGQEQAFNLTDTKRFFSAALPVLEFLSDDVVASVLYLHTENFTSSPPELDPAEKLFKAFTIWHGLAPDGFLPQTAEHMLASSLTRWLCTEPVQRLVHDVNHNDSCIKVIGLVRGYAQRL